VVQEVLKRKRRTVSAEYKTPGTFHGGTIQGVGITVEKASYEALEMEAQRALARD
jgi:hypothetical protein